MFFLEKRALRARFPLLPLGRACGAPFLHFSPWGRACGAQFFPFFLCGAPMAPNFFLAHHHFCFGHPASRSAGPTQKNFWARPILAIVLPLNPLTFYFWPVKNKMLVDSVVEQLPGWAGPKNFSGLGRLTGWLDDQSKNGGEPRKNWAP